MGRVLLLPRALRGLRNLPLFLVGDVRHDGFGDVVLPQRWRLLSGIEGISGVLLCGLSGAFIFAVINALFQRRMQQRGSPVKTYSSSETGMD